MRTDTIRSLFGHCLPCIRVCSVHRRSRLGLDEVATHLDDTCRHTSGDSTVWYVVCDDRSRRNDSMIANPYARRHDNACSHPGMVADNNGSFGLEWLSHIGYTWRHTVIVRVESSIRAKSCVAANLNGCFI